MKGKTAWGILCLSWGVLLSAQQLTANIRPIPGGIEIVERENAETPAFDSSKHLTHRDQRVLIDFMDLSSDPQAKKLNTDPKTFSQKGPIEAGREKLPFLYTSSVKKTGREQIRFSFRLQREKPENLKESFVSLRLNRALLDVPVALDVEMAGGRFWRHKLIFPQKHKGGWIWSTPENQKVRAIRIPLYRGQLIIEGATAPAMACKYGTNTGNLRLYRHRSGSDGHL